MLGENLSSTEAIEQMACEAGRSEEVYDLLKDMALSCTKCVAVLLGNCQKRQGDSFAKRA